MKKLLALILALAVLWTVAGCQLAQGDGEGETKGQDRLIGVLITTEHLDLFDMDAWLNDNLDQGFQGDVTIQDTSAYQGRIYAVQKEKTEDGITSADFVFEGIEGIRFFAPTVTDSSGQSHYGTMIADEGLSDVHYRINVSDTGEEIGIEGTVYVSGAEDYYFCMNPVYQDAQGRVYVVQGNSNAGNSLGEMTLTLDATATVTENGITTTQAASVRVTFAAMEAPEQIRVLQMNGDHEIRASEAYAPGTLPEEITPLPGTAYILVETQGADGAVSREIYSPDDTSLKTYYAIENGLCAARYTQIQWNSEE